MFPWSFVFKLINLISTKGECIILALRVIGGKNESSTH